MVMVVECIGLEVLLLDSFGDVKSNRNLLGPGRR